MKSTPGHQFRQLYSCFFKQLRMHSNTTNPALQKGAISGAVINGIINGLIYWFQVKDKTDILLTDNLISSSEHTVFASAVPLATSLAFILSGMAYFTIKTSDKPPYFPKVFLLSLKNAVFAFGIITIAAILLQRFAGSISVTPLMATLISGLIAGLVAGAVNYLTHKEIIENHN
jgi:uncharacterized membrane protein